MSEEELEDSEIAAVREGSIEKNVGSGAPVKGSALGAAVVVGAGALLASRVLGGGVLTGLAGVVAGTVAGRALARRRADGAVEEVDAVETFEPEAPLGGETGEDFGLGGGVEEESEEEGIAVFEGEVPRVEDEVEVAMDEVVGAVDLESSVPAEKEEVEPVDEVPEVAAEPVLSEDVGRTGDLAAVDGGEVHPEEADGDAKGRAEDLVVEEEVVGSPESVPVSLPLGFGELICEQADEALEVEVEGDGDAEGLSSSDEAVDAILGFDDLGEIYDRAVSGDGGREEETGSELLGAAFDPELSDVVSAGLDDGASCKDVESPDTEAGEESEESPLEITEAAIALEEIDDGDEPPVESELTPDEIWEMEALGRFTPAEQSGPIVPGSEPEPEADLDGVGKGLFPTRSELVGEAKEVALGASFFANPGAFDDLEDSGDEGDAVAAGEEQAPTDEPVSSPEKLPWRSLDIGGEESEPADFGEQKAQFESLFQELETPGAEPLKEASAGDVGSEDDPAVEPEVPVAETVEVKAVAGPFLAVEDAGDSDVSFVDLVETQAQRPKGPGERPARKGVRMLIFVTVVVIGMAGAAIVVLSQDLARPVMNWASAIFGGEDVGVNAASVGDGRGDAGIEESGGSPEVVVESAIPQPIEPEPEPSEPGAVGDAPMDAAEIEVLPALLPGGDSEVDAASSDEEGEAGLIVAGSGGEEAREGGEGSVPEAIDPVDAKSVLMGFLRADTVEQLIATVHQDDEIVQAIRDYYPTGTVPPAKVKDVRLEMSATVPSSSRETHLYLVQLEGEGVGIPVSVENTNEGYRIDWEAYVQCKDRLLARFAETGDETGAPRGFYVVMKRSHYFKEDVPDLEEKLCFHLTSPLPGDPGVYAFADKLSEEGRKLGTDTRWGALYFPVVRLSRVENPDGEPYLMLIDVVSEKWRSN